MTSATARSGLDRLGSFGERGAVRYGLILAGVVFAIVQGFKPAGGDPYLGYDTHAYWQAASLDHPYAATMAGGFNGAGGLYEYKYPPPLTQILAPLHLPPGPVIFGLWTLLLYGAFMCLAGRWAVPSSCSRRSSASCGSAMATCSSGRLRCSGSDRVPHVLSRSSPSSRRASTSGGSPAVANGAPWRWRSSRALRSPLSRSSSRRACWATGSRCSERRRRITLAPLRQFAPIGLPLRLATAGHRRLGALSDRRWVLPIAIPLAVAFAWWNVFSIMTASLRHGG